LEQEPIKSSTQDEQTLTWLTQPKGQHGALCGTPIFRGHPDSVDGWHVRGFRKSCGKASCAVCFHQVALKEARKAIGRLDRAAAGRPRWVLTLDPGSEVGYWRRRSADWWDHLPSYQLERSRANRVLAESGLVAWVMVFHVGDDRPELGCPWRGHWHVIADGDPIPAAAKARGWTLRIGARITSPVEWLRTTLERLSSYCYRRSIQRLTYGGACSNSKKLAGASGHGSGVVCPVCEQEIPKIEWLKAIPDVEPDFENEGSWTVQGPGWVFLALAAEREAMRRAAWAMEST
jgi:hypothetical protein